MFPGGASIIKGNVYIGDEGQLRDLEQRSLITTSSIDTLFIVLGMVDALIIILLLKNALSSFVEFRWLVLSSFFMMLGTSGHDFFFIHQWTSISTTLLLAIALLSTPFFIALYFWSQYRDIKTRYIEIFFMAWFILCLIILIPTFPAFAKMSAWYIWSALTLGCFIYSFLCAFKGIAIGRIGAFAQLLAISVYFLSIRTQWLPDTLFGHRDVQIGSLFYRYALLYAYFQQLQHVRLDYKSLSSRLINITDEVRQTIARELHDGLGQHLASIKLQLQLTKMHTKSEHLTLAEQELTHSVTGLRRLINGLHPIAIDHYCISEALQRESKRFENLYNANIKVETELISLKKAAELHVFRIFQECVNNSLRHGQASNIYVHFSFDQQYVELLIKDDGTGFDTASIPHTDERRGFGFVSLQERINLLEGQLDITSDRSNGSQIKICFSVSELL